MMMIVETGNNHFRLPMTKSDNLSIESFLLSALGFTLTGIIASIAGKIVTENTNAKVTPMATILPKWPNGGASEKFMVKKPIAVVRLVRKIGCILTRKLSFMAEFFSIPWRILK